MTKANRAETDAKRGPGRPPGSRVDADVRREHLLDAAESVIAADGPDASLARVAAAAGFTRSAVYASFSDRDAVIDALARRHAQQIVDDLRRTAAGTRESDPRAQTRAAVDLLAAWFDDNSALAPVLAARWRADGRSFVEETLTTVLTAGFVERGLDPAPAPVWARALIGAVASSIEWWAATREMSRPDLVDHVTDLLWSGLSAANPPTEQPPATPT